MGRRCLCAEAWPGRPLTTSSCPMREANQELFKTHPGACLTRRSEAIQISVVIPVYGSRACLEELHRRLVVSLSRITPDFEIVLVNDACPQNSWETIKE